MVNGTVFTDKVDIICLKHGIPKMQLYKDCCISNMTFSNWRTGKSQPSIRNIQNICNYLNISTEEFIEPPEIGTVQKELFDIICNMTSSQLTELLHYASYITK